MEDGGAPERSDTSEKSENLEGKVPLEGKGTAEGKEISSTHPYPRETLEEMLMKLPPEGSNEYTLPDICKPFKERFLFACWSLLQLVLNSILARHDSCFYSWYYDEFLKEKANAIGCQSEWNAYRCCVQVSIFPF